jgi:hypothetical protein
MAGVNPAAKVATIHGRRVKVTLVEIAGVSELLGDIVRLQEADDQWEFSNTLMADFGGLDQDYVSWAFPSFDQAMDFVESYYLSDPEEVAGWKIPIYLRPTWCRADIEKAIKSARQLMKPVWEAKFRDDHLALVRGRGTLANCWYTVSREDGTELHLRFDGKEAIIVATTKQEIRGE